MSSKDALRDQDDFDAAMRELLACGVGIQQFTLQASPDGHYEAHLELVLFDKSPQFLHAWLLENHVKTKF